MGRYIFILASLLSRASSAYMSAEALPKGVRAGMLVYGWGDNVTSTFNGNGKVESLVSAINRSVSIDDFAAVRPELKKLKKVLNENEPGLGDQLINANLYSSMTVSESRTYVGFMYGLSNKFALGFAVPYIKRNVHSEFTADVTNNAGAIREKWGNVPEISDGLKSLASTPVDTGTFEKAIFLDNGYKVPGDFEARGMGDVEVEARLTYLSTKWIGLALRSRIEAPTTTYKPDITRLGDRELTDNNWATKLAAIEEFTIIPDHLNFASTTWGIWRAPATRTMAFSRTRDQVLPKLSDPYQVEEVKQQIGAQVEFNNGLNLMFFRRALSLMGSYVYTLKQADRIYGHRDLNYDGFTSRTNLTTQAWEAAVEFSTIPFYLSKDFDTPAKLMFTWNQPIAGKNAYVMPFGRLDAVVLF
jgi:hypothetical protein